MESMVRPSIKELLESPRAHEAEDWVVAQIPLETELELVTRFQCLFGIYDERGGQRGRKRFVHLPHVDAWVALDGDDAALRRARVCRDGGGDVGPTFGAVAVVGGHALHRKAVVLSQRRSRNLTGAGCKLGGP